MKITLLKIAGVFAVITLFNIAACKPDEPTAEELFFQKLSGSWTATMVSVDNTVLEGAFDGFSITINADKTFTTTNGNAPIWPASGTLTAKPVSSTIGFDLQRSDGAEIEVVELSETSLVLRFHYTAAGGRSKSVTGEYEFELSK